MSFDLIRRLFTDAIGLTPSWSGLDGMQGP